MRYFKLLILGLLFTVIGCKPFPTPEIPETGYLKKGYSVNKVIYEVKSSRFVYVYGSVTFTVTADSMLSKSFKSVFTNYPNVNTELYKDSIDIFKLNDFTE